MAEVVGMLTEKKGQAPTPHELQKVAKEFADVLQKVVVLMKNSGIEGKHLPDVVKPNDVASAAADNDHKSAPKI